MEPWKERLVLEYKQLEEKFSKLREFLTNPESSAIAASLSTVERDMLVIQYSGMMLYKEALEARLEYYKILVK